MANETPDLAAITAAAFMDEFSKLSASAGMKAFLEGAKHEVGPALGAVTGAGLAKATGFDPLAGAAAGYGLGAMPDIVHAVREKRLASMMAKRPDIGGGI